jgi:nucleoside-diphosphate-sugar epimerase
MTHLDKKVLVTGAGGFIGWHARALKLSVQEECYTLRKAKGVPLIKGREG